MALSLIILAAFVILGFKSFKVVPQQEAHVVERLGKFQAILNPGLNILVPFLDRVAYRHSLKEIPLDVPSQVCITRDNTQLTVDGILYFQVTDPKRASYGSSNYILAITQLAQTTLRSVIGRMDLVPPQEILRSMQAQITAEREKRARIAQSEGLKIEQINLATGEREAEIQKSEGEAQAAINASKGEKIAQINRAEGEAQAMRLVAQASADAIRIVAEAIQAPGGNDAVKLKVAEQYVEAFSKLAKENNTMIMPANIADVGGLVAAGMNIVNQTKTPQ